MHLWAVNVRPKTSIPTPKFLELYSQQIMPSWRQYDTNFPDYYKNHITHTSTADRRSRIMARFFSSMLSSIRMFAKLRFSNLVFISFTCRSLACRFNSNGLPPWSGCRLSFFDMAAMTSSMVALSAQALRACATATFPLTRTLRGYCWCTDEYTERKFLELSNMVLTKNSYSFNEVLPKCKLFRNCDFVTHTTSTRPTPTSCCPCEHWQRH